MKIMPRKALSATETEKDVFPTRLRELMDSPPKTSQETLANALGITRQAVSNYKSGQSSPDWKTIASIAKYFNVSADYLLGLSDTKSIVPDLQSAVNYTGLSEKAVEALAFTMTPKYRDSVFVDMMHRVPAFDLFIEHYSYIISTQLSYLMQTSKAVQKSLDQVKSELDRKNFNYLDLFTILHNCRDDLYISKFKFSEFCREIPKLYKLDSLEASLSQLADEVIEKRAQHSNQEDNNA